MVTLALTPPSPNNWSGMPKSHLRPHAQRCHFLRTACSPCCATNVAKEGSCLNLPLHVKLRLASHYEETNKCQHLPPRCVLLNKPNEKRLPRAIWFHAKAPPKVVTLQAREQGRLGGGGGVFCIRGIAAGKNSRFCANTHVLRHGQPLDSSRANVRGEQQRAPLRKAFSKTATNHCSWRPRLG